MDNSIYRIIKFMDFNEFNNNEIGYILLFWSKFVSFSELILIEFIKIDILESIVVRLLCGAIVLTEFISLRHSYNILTLLFLCSVTY